MDIKLAYLGPGNLWWLTFTDSKGKKLFAEMPYWKAYFWYKYRDQIDAQFVLDYMHNC